MAGRAIWHWQGLLWWLVRHPELRGLPYPYPATETTESYERQPGGRRISAAMLADLIEFRNKVGFSDAFLEDENMSWALAVARSKTGAVGRIKQRARTEKAQKDSGGTASASAAASVDVAALVGPRGGLPKTKEACSWRPPLGQVVWA